MFTPDAVKGPTVVAEVGTWTTIPWSGIGEGMRTSKDPVDCEAADGDAPVAWTSVIAVPLISVSPNAAAAPTSDDGMTNVVW
jgi:hypothetical protein